MYLFIMDFQRFFVNLFAQKNSCHYNIFAVSSRPNCFPPKDVSVHALSLSIPLRKKHQQHRSHAVDAFIGYKSPPQADVTYCM